MSHAEVKGDFGLGGKEPSAFFKGAQGMDIISPPVKDPAQSVGGKRIARIRSPGSDSQVGCFVKLLEVLGVKASEIIEGGMGIRIQGENSFVRIPGGGVIGLRLLKHCDLEEGRNII